MQPSAGPGVVVYEYLISVERYGGADNPIVTVADQAAARVPGRPRAPLVTSRPQRPVRRALRVKTVETLPRPMAAETYVALLGVLRTRRDRALLEPIFEGGLRPGEALGLRLEDVSYGRRRIMVRYRTDHPTRARHCPAEEHAAFVNGCRSYSADRKRAITENANISGPFTYR